MKPKDYALIALLLVAIFGHLRPTMAKTNGKSPVIDNIQDMKDLKKLLRTKTNVLLLFVSGTKEASKEIKIFGESAASTKGLATLVLLDCSNNEVKKICKKMKVTPTPFVAKHYKDGDFHKDYDRQFQASSIVNFMRDPTGDLPWDEDPTGSDVLHLDAGAFGKLLKKETRSILGMFYAPWCGYCKTLKPEFSAAATELKPKYVLVGIDVNKPENSVLRKMYNITGFPTLLYFENGQMKYTYEGENKKDGLVAFMKNPTAPPVVKLKDAEWATETNSEIVHLTTTSFEPALKEASALVMFYANWCGHCKKMKPEYEKAAERMKKENIPGILAAVDAIKESSIGQQFGVKGYPTVKWFVNGEFKFDVNVRDADKIIEFMKNPSEPPPPPPPETPWDEEESEVVYLDVEGFKPFLKKKKHVLVMFYAPWCGHCKRTKPEFNKAAEVFKDDPRIELAAVDCTRHAALCSAYEVRGYPTIKYFSYLKTVKDYKGGRLEADLVKFLKDPDAEPTEDAPKELEPFGEFKGVDKILVLTDKNYKEELKKPDNGQMLIMFYAPWCGHCKTMKKDYAEAAERLAEAKHSGRLAVVDCTVQRKLAEEYGISGFPTLKYFEKGVFKRDYNGKRTANALADYVRNGGVTKDEL